MAEEWRGHRTHWDDIARDDAHWHEQARCKVRQCLRQPQSDDSDEQGETALRVRDVVCALFAAASPERAERHARPQRARQADGHRRRQLPRGAAAAVDEAERRNRLAQLDQLVGSAEVLELGGSLAQCLGDRLKLFSPAENRGVGRLDVPADEFGRAGVLLRSTKFGLTYA